MEFPSDVLRHILFHYTGGYFDLGSGDRGSGGSVEWDICECQTEWHVRHGTDRPGVHRNFVRIEERILDKTRTADECAHLLLRHRGHLHAYLAVVKKAVQRVNVIAHLSRHYYEAVLPIYRPLHRRVHALATLGFPNREAIARPTFFPLRHSQCSAEWFRLASLVMLARPHKLARLAFDVSRVDPAAALDTSLVFRSPPPAPASPSKTGSVLPLVPDSVAEEKAAVGATPYLVHSILGQPAAKLWSDTAQHSRGVFLTVLAAGRRRRMAIEAAFRELDDRVKRGGIWRTHRSTAARKRPRAAADEAEAEAERPAKKPRTLTTFVETT